MSADARTLARPTDPGTSHAAAADVAAAPRTRTIRERVALILAAAPDGLTHDQIIGQYRRQAAALGWSPASDSGIRTRVHELVADGTVERVPDTVARSRYGRPSLRWRTVQSSKTTGHDHEAVQP